MADMLTLADYQKVATELTKLLPSDTPLTATFEPSAPKDFPVFGVPITVAVRRVGSSEINMLLIVSDSVVAPLVMSGLGIDPRVTLGNAIEEVSGPLGEAITSEFSPSIEQFDDPSSVVFSLQTPTEIRGWFAIQIREVPTVAKKSDDSAQSPNFSAEGEISAPPTENFGSSAPSAPSAPTVGSVGNMRLLYDVEMTLTAEIGRAKLPVRQILDLTPGAIVELDRVAGSPADLMVNGHLVARGEVVVIDEDYGLRITEILDPSEAFA